MIKKQKIQIGDVMKSDIDRYGSISDMLDTIWIVTNIIDGAICELITNNSMSTYGFQIYPFCGENKIRLSIHRLKNSFSLL